MDRAELLDSLKRWTRYFNSTRDELIPRQQLPSMPNKDVGLAISGVRRCGKTTIAIELSKEFKKEEVLYYNFEDPLFLHASDPNSIETLISLFEEQYGYPPELMILDEVQNINGWELWVRSAIDQKRTRIVVTGSNAKLLSADLSTSLTGRTIHHISWPLSLQEANQFLEKSSKKASPNLSYTLKQILTWGALPQVLLTKNQASRDLLLRQYLSDIVHKDIINRHSIRNKHALDRLLIYYQTNLSSLHSYSAIKKAFGIPIDTISEYTSALTDAFLIFELERFHKNLKVQSRDPRKVYVVDFGLRRVGARSTEADIGKLLENLVYLELRRRNKSVYYYKQDLEVDFLVTENYQPVMAIQVCALGMDNPETRKRELTALTQCMNEFGLKQGLVITMDRNEVIKVDKLKIKSIAAKNWLLSGSDAL
jgi:uncharacterized protein